MTPTNPEPAQKIDPKNLEQVAGGQDMTTPIDPTPKQKEVLLRRESADDAR